MRPARDECHLEAGRRRAAHRHEPTLRFGLLAASARPRPALRLLLERPDVRVLGRHLPQDLMRQGERAAPRLGVECQKSRHLAAQQLANPGAEAASW